jgi:predicted TIM-barrel fold metal-dependent hydrolase
VTTADYAAAMKAVGPEHFVLASDLGQYLNPIPTDGMRAFLTELREAGLSDADLLRMSRTNAAGLLGMTD